MNWKRFVVVAFALVAALALLVPSASMAQSVVTGGISGTVTDPSGAVVADANLTLKDSSTGAVITTKTGAAGSFSFSLLKPDDYTITVETSGFKTTTEHVTVLLGQVISVNIKLELGSRSTVVEVTAEGGSLLQTEDANLSSIITTKEVSEIPNPGGDITYTAQTAPGITMNNSAGGGFGNFSAFGLPGTANLFTVNGNDENCPFLNLNNSGSSNLLLGGNEVQEVSVVINAYTGQYGRQAGAQLDYSTMSGTNQWHGDAVYDWTGRFLTANDPINKLGDNPRPFENNNQWAARLGGPIIKNKFFIFANTEGIRYIFGSIHTAIVPTPAFENFVLANVPQDPATLAFYNNAFGLYNKAPNIANAAPSVGGGCGPTLVLPNNAACTETFTDAVSSGNKEWLLSVRGDYVISDKDKVFARYKIDHGVQPTYTDTINSGFDTFSTQPQWEGQLNETHVFSSTVVNNFVGSILYYSAIFGGNPTPGLALFPGILNFTDGSLTNLGFGSGSPNGFAAGFDFPQGRNVTQYGIIDDLAVTRGNHGFKMGISFRRDDVSDHTASINTAYGIDNLTLAQFASGQLTPNGCVAAGNCGFAEQFFATNPKQPIAYYSLGAYFQDEFRVNSKLKLTLTMRADRNSSGVCQSDCASLPFSAFNDLPHGAGIPYDQSFQTGLHTILPNIEKVVFQPRLGVAWQPFGPNTVIRTGVGLFTDLYPGTVLSDYDTNFPQVNAFTVPTGLVAFDNLPPGSTAFPNAGLTTVRGCNVGFNTNFANGGNLNTYVAANPSCVNTSGGAAVPALTDINRNPKNPKYVEYNLEIQHSFGPHTAVSANYVGNRGYDEFIFNDYQNAFGFGNLPATVTDPRVSRVNFLNNNAYSNYNGLTLSVQQTGWHGLTARFNYTYSKALDVVSNGGILPFSVLNSIGTQVDPFNLSANYGPADYDARHQLTGSYIYELPFKSQNRLINNAIGGWQVSGTLFYHSGFPFSVVDGANIGGLAGTNNLGGGVILLQPNFSERNFSNGQRCLLAACFSDPANFTNPTDGFTGGVVGRNAFRGPGFLGGDMSVRKNFKINERLNFQLGLNAYNWFNHANYAGPVTSTAFGGLFGRDIATTTPPTSPYGAFAAAATDQRIAQIQGKLIF